MNIENKILSDIVVHSKYARYVKELNRRETWEELCWRNASMHIAKYPQLKEEIVRVYNEYVIPKKILPSMRSLQFGGKAIERNPARIYNCFSGQTEFMTEKGLKALGDVVGTTQKVLTVDGDWRDAEVKSFGKQNLNLVTLKHPYRTNLRMSFDVTANHRWILTDGSVTTDLKVGDRVEYNKVDFGQDACEVNLGYIHGLFFADGTRAKQDRFMIRLCGDKASKLEVIKSHPGFKTVCYPPSNNGDPVATIVTDIDLKTLPQDKSADYIGGFIRGWVEFDGYEKKNAPSWVLDTTDEYAADWLVYNAPYAGLIATGFTVTDSPTNYGIRNKPLHRISLSEGIKYWLVEEILEDYVLEEEVYCVVEPVTKSFTLAGGVLTGNCAYLPVEHPDAFSETMFLLLGGTGVGYSVQYRHISKLPVVLGPKRKSRRYVIGDSIEGWADAVKVLVEAYFENKLQPVFDYGDIRDKGTELVTSGGKAPGPDPLRVCLAQIEAVLHGAIGRQLRPIEAHDIQCFIADAVLAGGIRRAAMIALFSPEDTEMMECKSGNWWELNPQRARANNSVSLLRATTTEAEFQKVWERVRASGAGEPGIYWTNNLDWGTNPCCEIALRPYQFCNLCELNATDIIDINDFIQRTTAATFIGTLQAGYTDFHYLRPIWKQTTEEDALIGVGITGIAADKIDSDWLDTVASMSSNTNAHYAEKIGINPAARCTTIKPSGTSSLVLGSSSGIHAYHNDFYVRRMRFGKDEAIWQYLVKTIPELCEDEFFRPQTQGVLSIPQRAPQGAIVRTESPMELLERVRLYNQLWVKEGHVYGDNRNNVSCTISLKDDEWDDVGQWMWDNRDSYNGISVLPYDGGEGYKQLPFEDCSKSMYESLMGKLVNIDLKEVKEYADSTDLAGEAACAGGACEVF